MLFHFSFASPPGAAEDEALQLGASQEVTLSCGVTTDPSLWLLPPDEEEQEEQKEVEKGKEKKDVLPPPIDSFLDEQERETAASPCTSSSDQPLEDEVKNEVEEEKNEVEEEQSTADETTENPGEKQEMNEEKKVKETEEEQKTSKRMQWGDLVKAVVDTDQSLARVFYPLANRKTTRMLMEQLLCEDMLLMEEHYRRKKEQEQKEEEMGGRATLRLAAANAAAVAVAAAAELLNSSPVTDPTHCSFSLSHPPPHSIKEAEHAAAPAVAPSSHPDMQGHTHIDKQKVRFLIGCLMMSHEVMHLLPSQLLFLTSFGSSLSPTSSPQAPPFCTSSSTQFIFTLMFLPQLLLLTSTLSSFSSSSSHLSASFNSSSSSSCSSCSTLCSSFSPSCSSLSFSSSSSSTFPLMLFPQLLFTYFSLLTMLLCL